MVQRVAAIPECKLHSEEFTAQPMWFQVNNKKKKYTLQGKTHHLRLKHSKLCNRHLTFFFVVHVRITKHLFWAKGTQLDAQRCLVSLGGVGICSLEVATRHFGIVGNGCER